MHESKFKLYFLLRVVSISAAVYFSVSWMAVRLFVPVLHGCVAEVLLDELAEERGVGHVHPMGNLLGR